jgi:hypothetical protein
MPSWLTTGSAPVILAIVVGLVIIYFWVNYRLKRVQRELHTLGRSYYEKEQAILDDLKAGRITDSEYRKAHGRLVQQMREESRKITDGPPG